MSETIHVKCLMQYQVPSKHYVDVNFSQVWSAAMFTFCQTCEVAGVRKEKLVLMG